MGEGQPSPFIGAKFMITIHYIFNGKGIYSITVPDTMRIPAHNDIVTFGDKNRYKVSQYVWDMMNRSVRCELVSANYQ